MSKSPPMGCSSWWTPIPPPSARNTVCPPACPSLGPIPASYRGVANPSPSNVQTRQIGIPTRPASTFLTLMSMSCAMITRPRGQPTPTVSEPPSNALAPPLMAMTLSTGAPVRAARHPAWRTPETAPRSSMLGQISITSDVIVGFPGETEEDFAETLSLLDAVVYDAVFTFKYSPRPNTPSLALEDAIPDQEKSRRLEV